MSNIDIRVSWYCSSGMRVAAMFMLVAAIAITTASLYIGLPFALVCILMITAQYRLSIDFEKRTYYDYVWVLGIKNGEKGKFDSIQYIFITKSKVSQTMSSRVSQSTIVRDEFNAYLKLSETEKIHLRSGDSKKDLTNAMQNLAIKLKCDVVDYSLDD